LERAACGRERLPGKKLDIHSIHYRHDNESIDNFRGSVQRNQLVLCVSWVSSKLL
ncbi:hypothetical protein SERLA73DRAFT_130576, partial [Serpula lacrymans var. lacrymans S7.3]